MYPCKPPDGFTLISIVLCHVISDIYCFVLFYCHNLLFCCHFIANIYVSFHIIFRVSIRKTLAQFLLNETQNLVFRCASVSCEKTAICAIIRKSHFAQNCPIPLLRNSSFAQFRNFVIIICVYFLELKGFSPVSWYWSL